MLKAGIWVVTFNILKKIFLLIKPKKILCLGKVYWIIPTLKKTDHIQRVDISIIFAQGTLLINPQDPIQIKASSVFGNITLPDGQGVSFGERIFETETFAGSENQIIIKFDVVFGEGLVQEKIP